MGEIKNIVTQEQLIALATSLVDKMKLVNPKNYSLAYTSSVQGETVMLVAEPFITQADDIGIKYFEISLFVSGVKDSFIIYNPKVEAPGSIRTTEKNSLFSALEKRYNELFSLKDKEDKDLLYAGYQLLLQEC